MEHNSEWGAVERNHVSTVTPVIVSAILRRILPLPVQLLVYNVYLVLIVIKIAIQLISTDNRQKSENE